MASLTMSTVVVMAAILFVSCSMSLTEAQNIGSCAQKLIQCGDYLNTTTTPPSTCCNAIKDAVDNDLQCLCNLYNSPSLFETLKVNLTQAIALTRRCNVNADISRCNTTSAEGPTAGTTPPGVPGNDGSRMAWTGLSSLLLLWASSLFY